MKPRDLIYVILLVAASVGLADWRASSRGRSAWLRETSNAHLGAEYNNIATALISGRGFSDPFGSHSGPTAWMPPVLPAILAGMYVLTNYDAQAVAEIVVGLKSLIIMATGLIVLAEARRIGHAWLGYLVVPLGLAANFFHLFQLTHDVWLLLLVVDLLWLGLAYYWRPPLSRSRACGWGAFGGMAALCSPVMGAAWAASTAVAAWPRFHRPDPVGKANVVPWRMVVLAAVVSVTVVAPWAIRNRVVLGKWIPIKSNLAFEIWQSQCRDADGVLDRQLIREHPYVTSGPQRARYLEVGEIEFLEEKWPPIVDSISRAPGQWLRRIANRAAAALAIYTPYDQQRSRLWSVRFKQWVFPVPLLGLIAALALRRYRPVDRQLRAAALIYLFVLLPYILVSYGDRYAAPLLAVKLLLVLHGGAALVAAVSRNRQDPRPEACDSPVPSTEKF